jgi:hypothetical protein
MFQQSITIHVDICLFRTPLGGCLTIH